MIKVCNVLGIVLTVCLILVARSLYRTLKNRKVKPLPEKLTGRHYIIYLIAILVLGVIPRLASLFMVYKTDEGYYMYIAKNMYTGFTLYNQIPFVHPPLYPHATIHVFKYFGVGLIQAKLIPVLASILTLPLLYIIAKRFYGTKPALLTTFIYSISPLIIIFAGNPGMYPELIFFSLASAYFILTGVKENANTRILLAGLFMAVAVSYRLFGLWLILTTYIFLAIRKSKPAHYIAYTIGLLAFTIPFFGYYLTESPEAFPYMMLGSHTVKQYQDIGIPTKIATLFENISIYPLFFLLPFFAIIAGFVGDKKPVKTVEDADADTYFMLWLAGIVTIVFIPQYKDFLPNIYTIYYLPPLAMFVGKYWESLNVTYIRTLFTCVILLHMSTMLLTYQENTMYSADIYAASEYVEQNTKPTDTITGTYVTGPLVSFFTGRNLTEDVLNMTQYENMLILDETKKNADETCLLCENQTKRLMENAAYVLVTENEIGQYIKENVSNSKDCRIVKEFVNTTVYACA